MPPPERTKRPLLLVLIVAGATVLAIVGLTLWPPREVAPTAPPEAVVVETGSVARHQVIALRRDVRIEGSALDDVVDLNGSALIEGTVAGNVIVIAGDVALGENARIEGDVFAFGGRVTLNPGASVAGRTVSYPDAPGTWSVLLEGPALGLDPFAPVVVGAKLALLVTWLVTGLVFLAWLAAPLRRCVEQVARSASRSFAVGLVAACSATLWLLFVLAFLPPVVGLPLLLVLLTAAVALKLWGTVAVMLWVGQALSRRFRWRFDELGALLLGLLVLGGIKLLPWAGVVVWTAATLVGIGAGLQTRLARTGVE